MERLALINGGLTDKDLLAECRSGSREAMHALFVEHQNRVYSVALNFFGGNGDRAEDVTQQIFVKLFTKLDFRGESQFTTFLYRMTVNACIDETRKMRRFLNFADWSIFGEAANKLSPDERLQTNEIAGEVQAALAAIKPKLRAPIVLKYVEGLSYQEIADVLECSIGTVSSRLNRGHKLLASKLRHLKGAIQ